VSQRKVRTCLVELLLNFSLTSCLLLPSRACQQCLSFHGVYQLNPRIFASQMMGVTTTALDSSGDTTAGARQRSRIPHTQSGAFTVVCAKALNEFGKVLIGKGTSLRARSTWSRCSSSSERSCRLLLILSAPLQWVQAQLQTTTTWGIPLLYMDVEVTRLLTVLHNDALAVILRIRPTSDSS
jgi:hypothetical protein